jgi:hypothetical protein
MNGAAWALLVPAAIGFALSPIGLIELILVLFSKRRTVNTIVFVVGMLVFTALGVAIGYGGERVAGGGDDDASTGGSVLMLVLGALLLLMAVRNLKNRRDTSEPKVLATIGNMNWIPVLLLTPGTTIINPKNLVILVGAGQTLGTHYEAGEALIPGLLFVLLATLPFTATATYALAGGPSAQRRLDAFRGWLIAHNRLIVGIVCLVVGIALVGKNLSAL